MLISADVVKKNLSYFNTINKKVPKGHNTMRTEFHFDNIRKMFPDCESEQHFDTNECFEAIFIDSTCNQPPGIEIGILTNDKGEEHSNIHGFFTPEEAEMIGKTLIAAAEYHRKKFTVS